MRACLWLCCVALWVAGCGKPEHEATFFPERLEIDAFEGDATPLVFTATVTGTFSGSVYARIIDSKKVIAPDPRIIANPDGSFLATITLAPNLSVGTHEGHLELKLCKDAACTSQYPDADWDVPYKFEVRKFTTNLTPLERWAGVPDWEMFQGTATHSGYVPVTLDPSRFQTRWHWNVPDTYHGLNPVAVSNGTVYAMTGEPESGSGPKALFAFSEADQSVRWQKSFGKYSAPSPPAASGNRVFAAVENGGADTTLWAFDATSGATVATVNLDSQPETFLAPTIQDGAVYAGAHRGLYSYNFSDGTQRWFRSLNEYDRWTPAVDESYAYAYVGRTGGFPAGLNVINKATGAKEFLIEDPSFDALGFLELGAPVLGLRGSVLAVNARSMLQVGIANQLLRFEIAGRRIGWSVPGRFLTNPAVANEVVYIVNGGPYQLEARSEQDGLLLWSWVPPDEGTALNLIVTRNLVFLSTDQHTYAVSLESHQPVWTFPKGGQLALSANGVLYIAATGWGTMGLSALYAVNVK